MIYQISSEDARACFADLLTLAFWNGDDFIITRSGTPLVSLVSIKHLEPEGETHLATKADVKRMTRWTTSSKK